MIIHGGGHNVPPCHGSGSGTGSKKRGSGSPKASGPSSVRIRSLVHEAPVRTASAAPWAMGHLRWR